MSEHGNNPLYAALRFMIDMLVLLCVLALLDNKDYIHIM